jgi:FAD/FMN-containing dehydrogenase
MISIEQYEKKKKKLISDLLTAKKQGAIALQKSTSNLFRHRKQKNAKRIDVRHFNNVISIDKKTLTAVTEGMTPYEELVRQTLKHGLMPAVVPELKSITVGGAVSGVGIESSSFRYGLVHETIKEIEILLGNGSVVTCNRKNKHKKLFFGFPNSYGTLGYALKLKVRLIPVKRYVKLTNIRYNDAKKYFKDINRICRKKKADFVDGTIFNSKEMYITVGEFVNNAPRVSDYKYMDIYYKSIKKKKIDYLTVHDYIWRWDTDWFWCSKHFFVQNPVIRLFWGKKRLRSTVYFKLRKFFNNNSIARNLVRLFPKTESVVQDVEIPIKNCGAFIDFFHNSIGIKPVWVCPVTACNKKDRFSLYPMDPDVLYVNFGFWDVVRTKKKEGYHNRMIEKKVKELDGKKSLYSTSFYPKDEFWKLYNLKEYTKLKKKYDKSRAFLGLYEKCVLRR